MSIKGFRQRSNSNDLGQWFALTTRYKHEKKVNSLLEAKGYLSYLPLNQQVRFWKDRVVKVKLPLFNCYIFVFTDLKKRVDILKTQGVIRFVSFDEGPVPIPESQINLIRRLLSTQRHVELTDKYKPGTKVKVIRGPLKGVEGTYLKSKDQSKLILAMECLNQNMAVEISAQEVQPLN